MSPVLSPMTPPSPSLSPMSQCPQCPSAVPKVLNIPNVPVAVAEAVARRLRGGVLEREGTSVAVLQSDTRDHYRTFQMLERLLHAPPRLLQQLLFQIPPERQALLVQRYWGHWEGLGATGGHWDIPPRARPCSCSSTGQTGGTGTAVLGTLGGLGVDREGLGALGQVLGGLGVDGEGLGALGQALAPQVLRLR